jgi:phenylacetate-coenzyme A ligase PaaK-like adenylate-forming protein
MEVVDTKTAEPLEEGETGELVVTALTREALPMTRSRTADLSAILSRELCGCGRTHLRTAPFVGRIERHADRQGSQPLPQAGGAAAHADYRASGAATRS